MTTTPSMRMFAHHRGDLFDNIHPSRTTVEMCGPSEVAPVLVAEDADGAYWGWRYPDGRVSMIWRSLDLLDMCFPYGYRTAEECGQGRAVRLSVTLADM